MYRSGKGAFLLFDSDPSLRPEIFVLTKSRISCPSMHPAFVCLGLRVCVPSVVENLPPSPAVRPRVQRRCCYVSGRPAADFATLHDRL